MAMFGIHSSNDTEISENNWFSALCEHSLYLGVMEMTSFSPPYI